MSAFSRKVVPVSSTGVTPQARCDRTRHAVPARRRVSSASFPALSLATQSSAIAASRAFGEGVALGREQARASAACEIEHDVQLLAPERVAFGRPLDLDEGTGVVH